MVMSTSYLMALVKLADLRAEADAAARHGELLRGAADSRSGARVQHRWVGRRRLRLGPAQRGGVPVPALRDAPTVPAQRRSSAAPTLPQAPALPQPRSAADEPLPSARIAPRDVDGLRATFDGDAA